MTFYVVIENWDGGSILSNTGFRTEKEAKKMAKIIEKETNNFVSIHEITIPVKRKKKKKLRAKCYATMDDYYRQQRSEWV